MRGSMVILRIVLLAAVIMGGQSVAYAADPASAFLGKVFTEACVHNFGKPDAVRSWAAQNRLAAISDPNLVKAYSDDKPNAAVWSIPNAPGNVFLSLMYSGLACSVSVEAANPAEAEAVFNGIVTNAAGSDASPTVTTDESRPSGHGQIHVLSYQVNAASPKAVMRFSLMTVEQPGAVFQARFLLLGGDSSQVMQSLGGWGGIRLLAQGYLGIAWDTALGFVTPFQPVAVVAAAGIVLLFLLLRVYIGGFLGWLLRYVCYGGLFWFLITRPGFIGRFPPAPKFEVSIGLVPAAQKMAAEVQTGKFSLNLYIVAVIFTASLWLFVAIIGGIWRARRRRGAGLSYASVHTAGAGDTVPGEGGEKRPFNVTQREAEKKQTMVIMMTDIKGYSARMEKDEAATFALLKEHNIIMRRAITTNRGKEIKTIGDAFMVVFSSPIDAVRCGIAMQKDLHAFNKPRAANDHLMVRIGIHQGEVIVTPKDVFGEGVNIAARMESITIPGGLSISKDVYEAIKGKVEAGFQSVGIPAMKNIANPPEVFRVHLQF